MSSSPESTAESAAGATPPSSATTSTPMKNSALSPPTPSQGSSSSTITAQIADGTTSAASHDIRCCWRGEIDDNDHPRLASGWVTMWTSIFPECWTTDAPMPSSKIRAHLDRRDVPSTSWVAFISRAKSSSAVGTSSPTTVCTVAPRLVASSRTLPICGPDTPDSPSPRTTCTTISSALDFDAIRNALRTNVSDSGPPVTATTTRSRASQVSVMFLSARYFSSAAST